MSLGRDWNRYRKNGKERDSLFTDTNDSDKYADNWSPRFFYHIINSRIATRRIITLVFFNNDLLFPLMTFFVAYLKKDNNLPNSSLISRYFTDT